MKRAGLALLVVIVGMLLITACTDPVSNCLYRDQDQPGGTILRLTIFPANDTTHGFNTDPRNLVYRTWTSGTPVALASPYFCFYLGGPEHLYKGFNIYRSLEKDASGDPVNFVLVAENQKPETLRTVPDWSSNGAGEPDNDPIKYDVPTTVANTLDFPAYIPTLDGFKGEQYPGGSWAGDHGTTAPWAANGWSRYYPYGYYNTDYRAYGFVDADFDISLAVDSNGTDPGGDMSNFTWAVVLVDANGNMGSAYTTTFTPADFQ